ncbi:unnamed protein product, partial [Sphacelaria rigidula]
PCAPLSVHASHALTHCLCKMGDDLGDDWIGDDLGPGDEDTSAAVSVAPKSIKNKKSKKGATATAKSAATAAATSTAGRKRGRSQLSPEGYEDEDDG